MGPIVPVPVRLWTADMVIADIAAPCGVPPLEKLKEQWRATSSTRWIIDRKRETAEVIEHTGLGSKLYHWTIEDPPFWKNVKESILPSAGQ